MKTFKKVVVKINIIKNHVRDITGLSLAEYPEKENDIRVTGGYSDIGIQYEIDRGAEFFLQEVEAEGMHKVISETKIENPTVKIIRELDSFPSSLKKW